MLSQPDLVLPCDERVAVSHYTAMSALRTANVFTVPFDSLAETAAVVGETGARGEDSESETAVAAVYQWLVSQLTAARNPLPLTASGGAGSNGSARKCIIYLEPRRMSPLYSAIERFFAASAERFGPTEAHMYHPHSSMTGFIDLPSSSHGDESTILVAQIAAHLHRLIKSLAADTGMPRLAGVNTALDYPRTGTHKIEARLDTPAAFKEIATAMQRLVPSARIRPKRLGHISLAYFNKHVQTERQLDGSMAVEMESLAKSLLASAGGISDSDNLWDVAFYELASASPTLHIPHRFNLIARWHL